MLNKEKYAKKLIDICLTGSGFGITKDNNDILKCAKIECKNCIFNDGNNCYNNRINWANSEYKESILDDAEKRYLRNIIRPFRDRVIEISKRERTLSKKYNYIAIIVDEIEEDYTSNIVLPYFECGTMYNGMVKDLPYTLDELEI